MDTILRIKGMTKSFPGVKALDNIDMDIARGEVHAVVGENGAGKSTLMKILGGLYQGDSGTIEIDGKPVAIRSIHDSVEQGISVIYQEFNLIPHLTVAENIFLTRLPRRGRFVDHKSLNLACQRVMNDLGLDIDPKHYVSTLTVSQMQMVEIAKATSFDAKIVIMDEPTAALNDREVETLYRVIATLKEKGKTIIYISHRLKEIFDVSDRITVLRDGRKVDLLSTRQTNEEVLIRSMVGRNIEQFFHEGDVATATIGEERLRVDRLTKTGYYRDISFALNRGEILGFAGLMGCRREEIAKTLFGLVHADSGRILLDGREVSIKSTADAIRHRIMFTTDDRKNEGIFPNMAVRDNLTISVLSALCRGGNGLIRTREEQEIVERYTAHMNIKYASDQQHIVHLSGGNQQKVLLGRSLATGCEVLILLEPTRGIDVGAKSEIYRLLKELAAQGMAILMVTSETQELITLCDRVIVIHQGEITGELTSDESSPAHITEDNIMFCATGNRRIFFKEVGA